MRPATNRAAGRSAAAPAEVWTPGRVGRGEPEHETADERHACRHARREPQQECDDEAALGEVAGARRKAADPRDLGHHGESRDDQHPDAGRRPDPGVAHQPGRLSNLVAGLGECRTDGGRRDPRRALDLDPSADGRRVDLHHAGQATHVALDADLAGSTGHALHRHGCRDRPGRGGDAPEFRRPGRRRASPHAVLPPLDGAAVQVVRLHRAVPGARGDRARDPWLGCMRSGSIAVTAHRDACSWGHGADGTSVEDGSPHANGARRKPSSSFGQARRRPRRRSIR